MRRWLSAWLLAAVGCGGGFTTEAVVVEPAALPLRAYPYVVIVPGPRATDVAVARSLRARLSERGHTRVRIRSAERLRDVTARHPLPAASVVVELLVDTDERLQLQLDASPRTTCDSLGCYEGPPGGGQDVPTVRATLHVTVREGGTMRVVQRLRVRAVELGADYDDLQHMAVSGLAARLRGALEQIPRLVEVELLEVPGGAALVGVSEGLSAAEAGDFARARGAFSVAAAAPGAGALPAEGKAALLYDLGQVTLAAGGGTDPAAARSALRMLRQARRFAPESGRHGRAVARAERAVADAERVRRQRIAAARNHRVAKN